MNDSVSPGNSYYYGTNGVGIKGFFTLPSNGVVSIVGTAGQILANGNAGTNEVGNVTLTLATALVSISSITGGAGNMTITAGTGNSRTLSLQSTTSGGTATTFLTGNIDQSVSFPGGVASTNTTSGTIIVTGGVGLSGTLNATRIGIGVSNLNVGFNNGASSTASGGFVYGSLLGGSFTFSATGDNIYGIYTRPALLKGAGFTGLTYYGIRVANPGVISGSSTIDIAYSLFLEVPNVATKNFSLWADGPAVFKTGLGFQATSTATAGGTTTLSVGTSAFQIFTGSTTQTVQLPNADALSAIGSDIAVYYIIKNRSSGDITVLPAGSDTIDGNPSATITSGNSLSLLSDGISEWEVI